MKLAITMSVSFALSAIALITYFQVEIHAQDKALLAEADKRCAALAALIQIQNTELRLGATSVQRAEKLIEEVGLINKSLIDRLIECREGR